MRNSVLRSFVAVALVAVMCSSAMYAQQDEWYAHKGNTVEEVMSGPAGQLVIMRDAQGNYSFASPSIQTNQKFQVVAIGSEQVRLREANEKEAFMVPVMHNNLPLDLLIFATLILQQKECFVAAPVQDVVARYSGFDNYREEFADLLELKESSLLVYSDIAMAGKGGAHTFPQLYNGETTSSSTVHFSGFRVTVQDFVNRIAKQTGKKYSVEGDTSQTVSVFVNNLSPEAALHYVAGLTGVEVSEEAVMEVVAVQPEKTVEKAALSDEKIQKVLKRVKALAKAGRHTDAARLMLKLVKRVEPQAKYYNILSKLCWKAGAKKKAVLCLKKSLKVDPENTYARTTLKKIKAMRKAA